MYQLARRHFDAVDDDRIRLDVHPSNDVYYRVHSTRYMLTHGDMLGAKGGDGIIGSIGPISRGEIKFRWAAASAGQDYDTLVMSTGTSPCGCPA